MKLLLILTIFFTGLFSDELTLAYQKEYAYLVAEKNALKSRLTKLEKTQKSSLSKVEKEIKTLQSRSLSLQNKIDLLNQQISKADMGTEKIESDGALFAATILQAKESIKKSDASIESQKGSDEEVFQALLLKANEILKSDEKVSVGNGKFFLSNGEQVEGEVVSLGRVAKYGIASNGGGLLAPAGDGEFRVWDAAGLEVANSVRNGSTSTNIDIFLYESKDKALDKKEEKTFTDEAEAGGLVGYVIVGLGAIGIILVILRAIFLGTSGSNTKKLREAISPKIESGDIDGALEICKNNKGSSSSRVMAMTLRNIHKDRNHLEDIISESILHESERLDRFGSIILVIAAISPLLGLLGTVTGMISTFDIITEFGTGDPKMLSSGISEALITTKFGLIVAIPMLLLGNMLSGWAERIKDEMEQSALHIVNKKSY